MPRASELRSKGITVVNRLNILKAKFDDLTKPERQIFKAEVDQALRSFRLSIRDKLISATPESEEDSDIYKFRQIGWEKYGVQPYIYNTSNIPEKRKHGVTIKRGWKIPTMDHYYSGVNRVGVNIRFANIAPHAPLAILGEYKQSSWKIPKSGMHGGRRALMWGFNGKPIFKWVAVQGITIPITKKAPTGRFNWMIGMIERETKSQIPEVIDAIKRTVTKEFKSV